MRLRGLLLVLAIYSIIISQPALSSDGEEQNQLSTSDSLSSHERAPEEDGFLGPMASKLNNFYSKRQELNEQKAYWILIRDQSRAWLKGAKLSKKIHEKSIIMLNEKITALSRTPGNENSIACLRSELQKLSSDGFDQSVLEIKAELKNALESLVIVKAKLKKNLRKIDRYEARTEAESGDLCSKHIEKLVAASSGPVE